MSNELVIYLLVNKDLKMSAGKVAGQAARALEVITRNETNDDTSYFDQSYNELFAQDTWQGNKIIVLAAHEKDLNKFIQGSSREWIEHNNATHDKQLKFYPIHDAGHTQVEANSLTMVALSPYPKDIVKPLVKRFQLY